MNEVQENPVAKSFRRSESIAALAAAMAKAQGEIVAAKKDSRNPFFKSSYADLASIIEAIRKPFSQNGLAIFQFPRVVAGTVEVETLLAHSSGEWIAETLAWPVSKQDAHGIGSAITYARRYSLQSFGGVAAEEDDDGNAAVGRNDGHQPAAKTSGGGNEEEKENLLKSLREAAGKGMAGLEKTWKGFTTAQRYVCKDNLAEMKKLAAPWLAADERGKKDDPATDLQGQSGGKTGGPDSP